ncbi:RDD family protein [Streptomyces sp. 4N509B]|uniref:RDD family protein n=1 Tax=Streptomyces sp. 4N509B TaxID=3457413 RepID=UPI003FD5B2ED
MSQLVTGDAVVLGLQPARVPSRALAVALDLTVVLGGYLLATVVLLSAVMPLGSAAASAVYVVLLVGMLVGIPVAVETLSHGRSLGKLVCGLRVVRDDGGPVRFRHALVRGVVGFVEIVATGGSVALIASLVSAEGRRLGDVFAGTLVVRERIPGGRHEAALPPPPPWLAGQFAELDLSRVPEGLWLAIRQYLTRARQLDPQVAWSMAVTLCGDLMERTGSTAASDVHPAAYLAAVVAERQRRDAARAFGQQAAAPPAGAVAEGPRHAEGPWPGFTPVVQPPVEAAPAVTSPARPVADQQISPADPPERQGAEVSPPRRGFTPPS